MRKAEIKYNDATELMAYLSTISYGERIEFVTVVMARYKELKPKVRRSTFFNWKSMACQMPAEAKEIMESVAGQRIFSPYAICE